VEGLPSTCRPNEGRKRAPESASAIISTRSRKPNTRCEHRDHDRGHEVVVTTLIGSRKQTRVSPLRQQTIMNGEKPTPCASSLAGIGTLESSKIVHQGRPFSFHPIRPLVSASARPLTLLHTLWKHHGRARCSSSNYGRRVARSVGSSAIETQHQTGQTARNPLQRLSWLIGVRVGAQVALLETGLSPMPLTTLAFY
jgi:hypothetical protein